MPSADCRNAWRAQHRESAAKMDDHSNSGPTLLNASSTM
jgi:hypothetical protein